MIPKSLHRLLWSYKPEKLDIYKDKKAIIGAVLIYGDLPDMKTLLSLYTREEVKEEARISLEKNSWNKKSYNFWYLML